MKEFSAIFENATGNLVIDEIGCCINSRLEKTDFLNIAKPYLLYQEREFFGRGGFFYFAVPVLLWGQLFRLSVSFFAKPSNTSEFCKSYGLSAFKYGGDAEDEHIATLFEGLLSAALGEGAVNAPFNMGKNWHTSWGTVFLGATIQNGTEPKIGIGWKTD